MSGKFPFLSTPYVYDDVGNIVGVKLADYTSLAEEDAQLLADNARQAAQIAALREALHRISERPRGHHDCDDYSRGYGQCKADMANIADAALAKPVTP